MSVFMHCVMHVLDHGQLLTGSLVMSVTHYNPSIMRTQNKPYILTLNLLSEFLKCNNLPSFYRIVHYIFRNMYIKIRTWSWSANSTVPSQSARMYRLAKAVYWWQRPITFDSDTIRVNTKIKSLALLYLPLLLNV